MAEHLHLALALARGDFRLDVALQLPMTGTSVVFGPSGCGKSTLLRAIAGLEPQVRGTLRVGDACWQDGQTFLPPHRRGVGMVFQHSVLLPHLSVIENLRYGWKRASASLTSNYAFKPTAVPALGIDQAASCRGGLTRR